MSVLRIERVLSLPEELTPSTIYLIRSEQGDMVDIKFSNMDGSELLETVSKNMVSQMIARAVGSMSSVEVVRTLEERDQLELNSNAVVLVTNEPDGSEVEGEGDGESVDPESQDPEEGGTEEPEVPGEDGEDTSTEGDGDGEQTPESPEVPEEGVDVEVYSARDSDEGPVASLYIYNHRANRFILISDFGTSGAGGPVSWKDIAGRPESSAEEIDNAVMLSHDHENYEVLERLSVDDEGVLLFNDEPVGGGAVISVSEW